MRPVALLAVAGLTACSAAGTDTDHQSSAIKLAPTSELALTRLQNAIDRWTGAGLAKGVLVVADDGAPVSIEQEIILFGEPVLGLTVTVGGEVRFISVDDDARESTWVHELGHALGAEHGTGIMNWRARELIDATSLTDVCSMNLCDFFQPELM